MGGEFVLIFVPGLALFVLVVLLITIYPDPRRKPIAATTLACSLAVSVTGLVYHFYQSSSDEVHYLWWILYFSIYFLVTVVIVVPIAAIWRGIKNGNKAS